MLVDINKIIVADRIRKDFGDIQELADDIKQNGLINPPVVNKEYELLAGERRLRACKSLGWSQIEVRMMDTRDAEHELNIEISENENRKEFSKSERVDYMKRLLRIEQAKASERMNNPVKNSAQGKTRDITAKQFGISHDTMKKEMQIVDNKSLLPPSDFADWDEGRLSTNKAYQKIRKALADEKETCDFYKEKTTRLQELVNNLTGRIDDLEENGTVPEDYDYLKKKAKEAETYKAKADRLERQQKNNTAYNDLMERYTKKCDEALALHDQIAELQQVTQEGLETGNLSENVFYFCTLANNFVGNVGGLVWLTERIGDMPKREKELFLKAAQALKDFSIVFTQNLERTGIENGERTERTHSAVSLLTDQGECRED